MVDYKKWDHIEVSDDEDDTHPNIDTPSLFKWRHEARIQREDEMKKKEEAVKAEKKKIESKLKEVKDEMKKKEEAVKAEKKKIESKLKEVKDEMKKKEEAVKAEKKKIESKLKEVKERVKREEEAGGDNLDTLKKSLGEVEKNALELDKKKKELEEEKRKQPHNVDSLSRDGFSKTIMNTQPKPKNEDLTEEEREKKMKKFVKENEKKIKEYGMLKKFDDSKKFMMDGMTHLACDETANYLVIWCLDLEMEEKSELMSHVAHQCICMQYLLELAKQLDTDPRACISSFFSKIQVADDEYKNAFYSELEAFKLRIKKRSAEKIAEAIEEDRLANLGPGGLDPSDVFESLPQSMKACFESQDIGLLQTVIKELPEEEARYHMKRCVDSGLWVPSQEDPGTSAEDGFVK